MATLTPLRYPGGKDKTYNYIKHLTQINQIDSYAEPFAGGAAVAIRLLLNSDIKKIYINDVDKSIYAFWYSILNFTEDFVSMIQNVNISIDEWYKQKEIQKNKLEAEILELGFSTFYLNRTNRSGIIKAGVIGGKNQQGKYKLDCRFNKEKLISRIEKIAAKKNCIEVYNLDAEVFIKTVLYNKTKTLTFFDPPYFDKGPDLYTNFYVHSDHQQLAKTIKSTMADNYWILTYDLAEQISEIYSDYRQTKYYLNYSIAKPSKGQEFMFFSDKINYGEIKEFLNIV